MRSRKVIEIKSIKQLRLENLEKVVKNGEYSNISQ